MTDLSTVHDLEIEDLDLSAAAVVPTVSTMPIVVPINQFDYPRACRALHHMLDRLRRQLAKMASKMDKPNGVTTWAPETMPAPLMH